MRSLITIIIILSLLGCNNKKQETEAFISSNCFDAEKFGISRVTSNGSPEHIRIWYQHSFVDRIPMISLEKSRSGQWDGNLFIVFFDHPLDTLVVKEIKGKKIQPKSDWNNLTNKLTDLKIYDLPEMNSIPGLDDGWFDGSSYLVEIGVGSSCKHYRYHLPQKFQDKFWQAKNMVDILELMEQEFGIPWEMKGQTSYEDFDLFTKDSTFIVIKP
jgi:hypothetical protein